MKFEKGDVVIINGLRGVVNYIGRNGHLGVDLDNGTFRVVAPQDAIKA